ncbi:MAG TPA: hypothetical protein VGM88_30325 [Kofleriaceae bacterium]
MGKLFLSFVLLCACAHHHDGGGDDTGPDGGGQLTLAISPATATVALADGGGGAWSATQAFTAIATYADGHTADVTSQVFWSSDDAERVVVAGGTATVSAAGHYAVQATLSDVSGNIQGSAGLDATLTGSGFGSGFDPADTAKLDGTPDGSFAPAIAYPLAGALVPENVAPISVQVQAADGAQTLARISLTSGALLAYDYYAVCAPSPNPGTFAAACLVDISGDFATQLAGVSESADVSLTVRLAATDGTKLGESPPIALAWAKTKLTGGLYYWTTAGTGDTAFNTAIARYDFSGDASAPMIYLSSADAPAVPAGQPQCIGCHSVSPNGTHLAFSLGGSTPGFFSDYDVASTSPIASNFTSRFADMSTFSPDGGLLVTMAYGDLTLRSSDATLGTITDGLFPEVTEEKSHPAWSSTGDELAFVSWNPTAADHTNGTDTGDMVEGGQIWLAPVSGQAFGTAGLLVPRQDNWTSYYPNISDDDHFVVFNQSHCDGPANTSAQGWGLGACDGYNDISATLHVIATSGGDPIALTAANGGDDPLLTNSWPRWSPDHGTFRGKTLYWIAFSSRRGYGLSLASGAGSDVTKPQLWFAAVALDPSGAAPTVDPSFAPVWLPGQDPDFTGPRGNHTPAWTRVVVTQ